MVLAVTAVCCKKGGYPFLFIMLTVQERTVEKAKKIDTKNRGECAFSPVNLFCFAGLEQAFNPTPNGEGIGEFVGYNAKDKQPGDYGGQYVGEVGSHPGFHF